MGLLKTLMAIDYHACKNVIFSQYIRDYRFICMLKVRTLLTGQVSYFTSDNRIVLRQKGECVCKSTSGSKNRTQMQPINQRNLNHHSSHNLDNLREYMTLFLMNLGDNTSLETWKSFEEHVTTHSHENRLKGSWETYSMNLLYKHKHLQGALSLLRYIRTKDEKPNISTLTAFVAIVGICGGDEQLIFDVYDELLTRTNIFDISSCINLITGFTKTTRWKESLKFIEMVKIVDLHSIRSLYNLIAEAAFHNHEFDFGCELLNEIYSQRGIIADSVFLEAIRRYTGYTDQMNEILEFMRKSCYFPSLDVVSLLENHFTSCDHFQVSHTWVSKSGVCSGCGLSLGPCELSDQEFTELRDFFLRDSFITDNPYIKSNPQEVRDFLKFLEVRGPFEIVVDGLNVANLKHPKSLNLKPQKSLASREQLLLDLVMQLKKSGRKVLLLGRKHMLNWPLMKEIKGECHYFLTANNSEDDPFILYATLSSGPQAMFVSRDEMNDHKHLMGHVAGDLFRKWQRSRQIVNGLYKPNGEVSLKYPRKCDTLVQNHGASWHIPYRTDAKLLSFEHPNTWLCARYVE